MKLASGTVWDWVGGGVLLVVLAGGGWLIKANCWPRGSDEMFVVTNGTLVRAIVVCSDSGEVLWRIRATEALVRNARSAPYGKVPAGFVQESPDGATAPA